MSLRALVFCPISPVPSLPFPLPPVRSHVSLPTSRSNAFNQDKPNVRNMTYKSSYNLGDYRNNNGSSNDMEDALRDREVLPSYESLTDPPAATGSTPPGTTGSYDAKRSGRELVRQGRSGIFNKYLSEGSDEGQGWAVLSMRMVPDPGAPCYGKAPWAALLEVKTADMPRLMREGFFWSAENIIPEEGYFSRETKPGWVQFGFHHKRTWILADKSNDKTLRWVGFLEVFAHSLEILPSFRVQNLTRENVYTASALNGLGQLIYHYTYQCPQKSFNCIYDDKPLQGWWPWPRVEARSTSSTALGLDRGGEPSKRLCVCGCQSCPSPNEARFLQPNEPQYPYPQSGSCVIL
ncbi:uncharacterized protein B0H64DRAFT_42743 [Chaetomium fimeti]|uniref:Uncharacterized protein n=1 Tax=Chaetomium fimeti TaxID=1854472 RepID=A0AAE0H7H3_9PEZI|nr:hypothetical protein B0H64DRAFT_42743 [Chaetomium fimeti]